MNDTTKTGAVAITGGMLTGVIVWVFALRSVQVPADVAATLSAIILYGAHVGANFVSTHWPPRVPAPAPMLPAPALPAPAPVIVTVPTPPPAAA